MNILSLYLNQSHVLNVILFNVFKKVSISISHMTRNVASEIIRSPIMIIVLSDSSLNISLKIYALFEGDVLPCHRNV